MPDLTPKQMLALGVFAGKYMTDCRKEFPKDWFALAKLATRKRNPSLNYFAVDASQPLSVWKKNGWIHADDPRGWFQWYCRYHHGPPHARRGPPPEQTLEGDSPPRRADQENCEAGDLACRRRQR